MAQASKRLKRYRKVKRSNTLLWRQIGMQQGYINALLGQLMKAEQNEGRPTGKMTITKGEEAEMDAIADATIVEDVRPAIFDPEHYPEDAAVFEASADIVNEVENG